MGYVPTSNLSAWFANTEPGQVADATKIDPAVQDIVNTVNENYDFVVGLINSGTVTKYSIVNVIDFGARGDGSTNDSNAVQSAINSVQNNGGGYVYFPKGTYLISNIQIGNKDIIIVGQGRDLVTLKKPSNDRVFTIVGDTTNSIYIKGLSVDGNQNKTSGIGVKDIKFLYMEDVSVVRNGVPGYSNPANRGSIDGVFAENVEYAEIVNCEFSQNERDGFLGFPVKHITIRDSRFIGNGRLASASTQNQANTSGPLTATFVNNYVYQCGAGGFDVETHTSLPPAYFTMRDNNIIDCGDDNWGYGWGLVAGINSTGVIEGNKVLDFNSGNNTWATGITSGSRLPVKITNNEIRRCGEHGIYTNSAGEGTVVSNNTCAENGIYGIAAYDTTKLRIDGNYVVSNQQHGIDIFTCSYVDVEGNHISNNSAAGAGLYSGIRTRLSSRLNIIGNEIRGASHQYGWNQDSEANIVNINFFGNQIETFAVNWWNFAGDTLVGSIFNGKKHFYKSSIPTSGTFRQGDYVQNTSPSISGVSPSRTVVKGWIRLTNGSNHTNFTDWFADIAKE